jgi:hypothetical protein
MTGITRTPAVIASSGTTKQPRRHCTLITRLLRSACNDRGGNDRGGNDRGARGGARFGGLAFAPSLLTLALFSLAVAPHAARAVEPRIVFDLANSKWTVQEDGTWTVDADATIRAPRDNVSHVVRVPLSWSASTEKLQVVQARIDKPDGRSVILTADAVREASPSGDANFHEFSDERRIIITFTDARDGDLLVVRAHRDVFHPRVPGGFMAAPVLDRSVGWEETNFTISVPSDMALRVQTRGFDQQKELIKDRVMYYLHSPKIVPPIREIAVLGEFDRLPMFAVSTFRNYNQFAKAYGSILLPHAKVTPAIKAMADKLTAAKKAPGDQAQALYEFTRDNVRLIPIALEASNAEPHDAEQVLTRLYGDNQDQVVLLSALLSAKGIASEIALLNSGDATTIADPPNIRPMNHLVLYLPVFSTYADPSVPAAPAGALEFNELGKPAIHLTGAGLGRHDIPMPASGSTVSDMKTDMVMDEKGDVTGTTTTTARGSFGVWLRMSAKRIGPDHGAAAALALLREHGTPGLSGNFNFAPPDAPGAWPGSDYTISGTFQLTNQAALLHGGFFSLWTGLRMLPRPGDLLGGPEFLRDLPVTEPSFCFPGIQTETLSLTIPEGRALGTIPEDTKIDNENVHYSSHWTKDGRKVTVTREFQSLLTGPVCKDQTREEMADVLAKIRADLVSPLGFKYDALPDAAPGQTDGTVQDKSVTAPEKSDTAPDKSQ